ncbi:MAG: aminodeoxychorismate synthase component I [Chloroflexi bacterium]|nr:aminodeoxychorismate synthase component I [Chloroflexota bacterium]
MKQATLATPILEEVKPAALPTAVFPVFLDAPYPILLDSALLMGYMGRFSYLTADPFLVLRSKGTSVEICSGPRVTRQEGDPFLILQTLLRQWAIAPIHGLPPFQGGAVGYFAYELGRHLETLPQRARDDLRLPELCLGFYDWALAYDHAQQRVWIVSTGLPEGSDEAARARLAWVRERLRRGHFPSEVGDGTFRTRSMTSTFSHAEYLAAVEAVKEYIAQGEVYQVNLSQRFQVEALVDPWALYLGLRRASPAPFAAYLGFPEAAILSASPEEFLRLDGQMVTTRPIKGTRPRGRTPEDDRALATELLASAKDRAENLMIVDLLRNDLGRVCRIGSVRVPELFALESFPTVHHLVSTVGGDLREGLDAVDLLRACFPGGSITGAPKIRAMEIIDELEPVERSVYCGAIGYIGFDGSLRTSIAIRIIVVKDGVAYVPVGGGIVADSDPEAEYQETLDKARGAMTALGLHG